MFRRMLRADLRRSSAIAVTLTALIALAAALVAMSVSLIVRTNAAIDGLWAKAHPPDVVQMNTGEVDEAAIAAWAESNPDVDDHLAMRTLPVRGKFLWIDGVNQAESVLEPAFVTAPESFDLLLGSDDKPARPGPGEIALPVHYLAEGDAKIGDTVRVGIGDWSMELKVVDFVRDPQMNPSLVTSKRLVVNPHDFAALDAHIDDVEYIVEFRLADGSDPHKVLDAYAEDGLPSQGIAVDSSIFRMMNGLTTLLVAAVALVVALLLVGVALLALRYAALAAIETDLAEIAVLKAIGAQPRRIKRLYLLKYLMLTLLGVSLGYAVSLPMAKAMASPVLLYLGQPPSTPWTVASPILAAVALGLVVVGFCRAVLRRMDRISAVEALRSGASGRTRVRRHRWRLSRRRRLAVPQWMGLREAMRPANGLLVGVFAVCTFIAILPVNVVTTIEDPRFTTYLGIGQADLRVDVRDGAADLNEVTDRVVAEPGIARHVRLVSRNYRMRTVEGKWESIVVESGDHTVFPLRYERGGAPTRDDQIALSHNQAEEVGAGLGDTVSLRSDRDTRRLRVSGIYQDITNGGKTAKVGFDDGGAPLWQLIYVDLDDGKNVGRTAKTLSEDLPGAKVTETRKFVFQTFSATSSQVRLVAGMAAAVAVGLAFLIAALFAVLIVARERGQIALQRALGTTTRAIVGQYLTRFGAILLCGVVLGAVAAQVLGQMGMASMLGALGAPGVVLLTNGWLAWVALPVALALAVSAAVGLALRRIGTITVTERE